MNAKLFRHPFLNGWPLFWLLVIPMVGFMASEIARHDLKSPEALSELIGYSVRWSVPFIYWVIAGSAMPVLFPGQFSSWWSRNRRFTGLVFAAAMLFQGIFIFSVSTLHPDYYYTEIYFLRDELEGTSGYVLLAAMVATSFDVGRRALTGVQWKVVHRTGVYFLWAYAYSVYWWNLFYYPYQDNGYVNEAHDHLFYAMGFLAFAARIAAWTKRRLLLDRRNGIAAPSLMKRGTGIAVVVFGLAASATGQLWSPEVSEFFSAAVLPDPLASAQLWLPFWPLEPFMPLILLGIGAWLYSGGFGLSPMASTGSDAHSQTKRQVVSSA